MANALKSGETTSIKHLTYTPVTVETFAKWCDEYKARTALLKESKKSDLDSKPTGKQLFMMNREGIDDLVIEDEDVSVEEDYEKDDEETKEEDEGEEFKIDRSLFEAEDLEEEVDFEDD